MSVHAVLLVVSAVCLRNVFAFSTGAPTLACPTLTQMHPGVSPMPCTACPFNVSLVAIDGGPVNTSMYRCGSRHTIRLESSGATFRGLAVQAREASSSFTNDADFVGEFVNPPADGDWIIWSCAAPSATHRNAIDKTTVDLTWQAPGINSTSDVTIWFAITRFFTVVHAQLRGMTLSPDPAFCAPPSLPGPLVLNFINDSPRVAGGNITADISLSRPVESLMCALSGQPYQDCSSGSVTFVNVPQRDPDNRFYFLRVVGTTADGQRTVIRRGVRVEEEGFCLVHFINDGVTVEGSTATIEFEGTGDFNTFLCDLDRQGLQACSSPQVYTELSAGDHRVKVVPNISECGRNRRPHVIRFTIA